MVVFEYGVEKLRVFPLMLTIVRGDSKSIIEGILWNHGGDFSDIR